MKPLYGVTVWCFYIVTKGVILIVIDKDLFFFLYSLYKFSWTGVVYERPSFTLLIYTS